MSGLGLDYYQLDDEYTEEEKLVRDNVRRFVDQKLRPIIAKHYEDGTFPSHLIKEFGEIGLLGCNLTGYDCPGMGDVAYGLAMQELERCDSGIRSFCSVQGSLAMYPIWAFGSEEQKQKYLPKMTKGELIGCFGLTEPDYGSNPTGMITRADKVAGGYKLNGAKRWITNGTIADVAVVWAKLEGDVRGFIVDKGTKGFTAEKISDKWSLRASVTAELLFEDCVVPENAILPNVRGMKGPLSCLSQARYGIAWGVIGAAVDCYEVALGYAKDRKQFSRPIAGYQLVQQKLVTWSARSPRRSASPSASAASRRPRRSSPPRSPWPSATTSTWRSRPRARPATSWAATGSCTRTRRVGTC
jgi:glutaryl-CoA dehydrogenase